MTEITTIATLTGLVRYWTSSIWQWDPIRGPFLLITKKKGWKQQEDAGVAKQADEPSRADDNQTGTGSPLSTDGLGTKRADTDGRAGKATAAASVHGRRRRITLYNGQVEGRRLHGTRRPKILSHWILQSTLQIHSTYCYSVQLKISLGSRVHLHPVCVFFLNYLCCPLCTLF